MRLQEILTEAVVGKYEMLLFQQIQSECSTYLQVVHQAGDQYLYRGVNCTFPYFTDQSKPGRKPTDSDLATTILFDQAMTQAGFAAQRRNSKFATGDLAQAAGYPPHIRGNNGSVYVIFPVNGFQFSWSQKHKDLILDDNPKWIMDGRPQLFDQLARNLPVNKWWKTKPKLNLLRADWLKHWGDRQDMKNWLINDIKIPREDLAKSTEYRKILVIMCGGDFNNPEWGWHGDARDWTIADLPAWQREFQMTDQDLPSAIQSGNEVLIQGKFHAIQYNSDTWHNWVNLYKAQ